MQEAFKNDATYAEGLCNKELGPQELPLSVGILAGVDSWFNIPLHGTDVTEEPLVNVSLPGQHKHHQQALTYRLFASSQWIATRSLPQEETS